MLKHVNVPLAVACGVLVVAGMVALAVSDELSTASIVGFVALGLGGIGLMAIAFYAVGRSEDEERAKDRRP